MQPVTPVRLVAGLIWRYRWRYLLGVSLLLATNAGAVVIPQLLGQAIDAIKAGAPGSAIERYALIIAGLALAVAAVRTGSRLAILGGSRYANYELKTRVFQRMLRLDIGYHQRLGAGDLISRVAHDARQIRSLMGPAVLHSVNMLLLYVLALWQLLAIDPVLTGLVVLPLVPMALMVRLCSRRIYLHSRAAQEVLARLTTTVAETIAGMLAVRSYAAEGHQRARFDEVSSAWRDELIAAAKARGLMLPLLQMGTGAGMVVILVVGGRRVADGAMTLGQLAAVIAYLGMLGGSTFAIGWVLSIFQRARPAMERVCAVLNEEQIVRDPEAPRQLPVGDGPRGGLVIEGLSWSYPGAAEPALRDVSFSLPAGATVALLGRVGSGKSTLLALLSRLRPASAGAIALDGVPLEALSVSELRGAVVQVPQDAFLFSRPIDENIAYGEPEVEGERVREAAGRARVDREIEGFVDGYRTWVGERGVTLSGGQRQRVTLARALIAEPAVLILDDATSSLDAATEREILDELFRLRAGKTTILVTHRTATAALCDQLVVLDAGRLEAAGPTAAVVASSPTLRAMAEQERLRGELAETRVTAAGASDAISDRPDDTASRAAEGETASSDPSRDAAEEREPPSIWRMGALVLPHWKLLAASALLIPLMAGVRLALPALIKQAVDYEIPAADLAALDTVAWTYVALIVLAFAAGFLQTLVMVTTGQQVMADLRASLFDKLLKLPASTLDRTPVGRLLTRLTSDAVALGELFSSGLVAVVADLALLVGIAGAMLWLSPVLALWTLALVPPLMIALWWLRLRLSRTYRALRERISRVNAYLAEALSGIAVTQLFRQEPRTEREFDARLAEELKLELVSVRWDSTISAVVELSGTLSVAVILWAGGAQAAAGVLTIGILLAFIAYTGDFYAPLRNLSERYTVFQAASAAAEKVFSTLDQDEVPPPPSDPVPATAIQGAVAFEGVRFGYGEQQVLHGIDITIAAGEQVGVVGPTGAGKSTLIKLLGRHYAPDAGRILLDGEPLSRYDPQALRRAVGLVPQDGFLFNASVASNLRLGRDDLDDARLLAALESAEALPLTRRLGGLEGVLAERGTNLSAGERQLLAFARVMAHDPPVLVLDEATSAVDHQTEELIQAALARMLVGRTALVIAHRLSTLERVDRIVVLEDGRVSEQGTHDELLAAGGTYRQLYELQFGLAKAAL